MSELSATEIVLGELTSTLGRTHVHVAETIVQALADAGHLEAS